jgi:acylphosphatase
MAIHATIHRRAQGIFFRAFVDDRARFLGLTGWVRNGSDGANVEVIAQGDEAPLEVLLASLRDCSSTVQVEQANAERNALAETFSGFSVR